jgi:RTX calcium-binding nonapeptide repeat (4 copies)
LRWGSLHRLITVLAKRALPALLAFGLLALSGAVTESAQSAPCPYPTYGLQAGGELSIQGTPPCAEEPEHFVPFCSGGIVRFEYGVNGVDLGPTDTAVPCSTPSRLSVHGNGGDDTIDLSQVSAGNGFTGITQPNLLDGGYGRDELVGSPGPNEILGGPENDVILARNDAHDAIDCGTGTDAVQSDQAGVDALSNCEIVDLLPTPPTVPTPAPARTGKRAAAQRKCRKLKRRSARRRCFGHAKSLPV